ncbi:MAG TPA: tetrahydrofolate dehydrogenase/cyclohydrolase catalytic domain-containing protein [Dinghuibacter sp.]|jgi:methylenetetrahydrofolate dehydrogenase (NADP+)/methenyltetrahydrofolate cyclohydrolase|uniref:bifunctional 5,10-methylenetetrahydrofolate dehydrogenase/5,10-methenyltetrahydrofolate cyclohydrolase n=1 Tax=Dinghuibacter sp. TaxID=2024697 RepID=UPI002D047E0D|nr:tetrahydrofolate dehydrogenase/cyclohydrolase catalytic domain-containing protein [Dinghuibacter sp.]HTJ13843.1 tetrahydrofolate dehydrogenase/cyclohydrolase catalytic domain-containing protein [Dinghuibacter sp.]
MQKIDGKLVSQAVRDDLAQKVKELAAKGQRAPHLAAILVGNDGGSETYVAAKVKDCEEIGFGSTLTRLPDTITEHALLDEIRKLNQDSEIDGIIVQLPLPRHISPEKVINTIDPGKDVDGFHPESVGRMVGGMPTFVSATPFGIMMLLEYYKIETKGKHAVVIGRSAIVGTPVSILLSRNAYPGNCTVTLCHSATPNIRDLCLQADIVVAAIGKPGFVTGDMVKPGAVVIDVGTTRVADPSKKTGFSLKGDVAFDEVAPLASFITPVPGGVGPMTRAALMKNTFLAYEARRTFTP